MFGAIAVLFLVPWLDRSPVKSYRYRGVLSWAMLMMFVVCFLWLGKIGAGPGTDPTETIIGRVLTFLYFAFFITMPVWTKIDKTKPVPERVNDLSLKVTSPGGVIYWGNNGLNASNTSAAGGVANTVDTVENVFLVNPQAGTWTVEVIGTSVAVDAYPTGKAGVVPVAPTDAGFSLVVTGGVAPVVNTCYPNCDGSSTQPILTANDFQCFLNAFAASNSYANCDGSTSAPTLTANDFQCFLNSFAAGCS